jgi:hypothetical protein
MLKHIAKWFAIEKDIRGRSPRNKPLADAFQKCHAQSLV